MPTAPARLFNRLNTQAPSTSAKKNSFRSAPRIVSGRFNDRKTGLVCIVVPSEVLNPEQPSQEVNREDGHPRPEAKAGKGFLPPTSPKAKAQPPHTNATKANPLADGPENALLQTAAGVSQRWVPL